MCVFFSPPTEILTNNHFVCLSWSKEHIIHSVTRACTNQHSHKPQATATPQQKSSREKTIHFISKNYLHQSMQQTYHLILWTYQELAVSSELNLKRKFRLLNMKEMTNLLTVTNTIFDLIFLQYNLKINMVANRWLYKHIPFYILEIQNSDRLSSSKHSKNLHLLEKLSMTAFKQLT